MAKPTTLWYCIVQKTMFYLCSSFNRYNISYSCPFIRAKFFENRGLTFVDFSHA